MKQSKGDFRDNFKQHRMDFYVTPGDIFWDDDLSATEQRLLVFIAYLDQGERGCYASNTYLAAFANASERSIRSALAHFQERGFIDPVPEWNGEERNLHIAPEYRPLLKGEYKRYPPAKKTRPSGKSCQTLRQDLPDYMDESGKGIHISESEAHKAPAKNRTPQRVVDLETAPQDVVETAKALIIERGAIHVKNWESTAAKGLLIAEVAQLLEQGKRNG